MARISGDEWLQRACSLVPARRERSAEAGKVPSVEDELPWRRNGSFVATLAGEAGHSRQRRAGANAIFNAHPLQRMIRDLDAGLTYAHVSWDVNGPAFGRVALGLPPENPNI